MKKTTSLSALRLRGLAVLSALALGACLQTDPDSPDPKQEPVIPQDDTRRAGTSSSTNWPPDFGSNRIRIHWELGSDLMLSFDTTTRFDTLTIPVDFDGTLRFYKSGVIPALEAPIVKELRPAVNDTVIVPGSFLDTLWNTSGDTIRFNLHFSAGSRQGWMQGFQWSRSKKQFVGSPIPPKTEESPYIRFVDKFFEGNLKVDSSVITPAAGNSEFCFYIPGTPVFQPVRAGSHFKIGPMPKGEYPLRLLRLTQIAGNPGETLVEVWEAPIEKLDSETTLTPGAKVFSARTQGTLNLRRAE